jgi:hypothetical protein
MDGTSEERARYRAALDDLQEAFSRLTEAIGDQRASMLPGLEDRELLALAAWTVGRNEAIESACRMRAGEHEEQARRFGAISGETELVPVLAERSKSS